MPIHDYRCTACGHRFEMLVLGALPACRQCASTALERQVSLGAPPGKSQSIIAAGRRAAAAEGHFSQYSKAEKSRIK